MSTLTPEFVHWLKNVEGFFLPPPPPIQDGRLPGGEIELHNYNGHRITSVIPLFHIILMREIHFWCYLDDLWSSWGQQVKLKVILPKFRSNFLHKLSIFASLMSIVRSLNELHNLS